jgi:hypothetical protein
LIWWMRCQHFFHRRDGLSHVFLHFLPQSTIALSTQFSGHPHTDDPPRKASAALRLLIVGEKMLQGMLSATPPGCSRAANEPDGRFGQGSSARACYSCSGGGGGGLEAAAGVETAQGAVKTRDYECRAVGQGSQLAMLAQGLLAPSAWVLASKPLSMNS